MLVRQPEMFVDQPASAEALIHEQSRLEELYSYEVLNTTVEKDFDDVTTLAAHICNTPLAFVSLIDENRQWFKSHFGTSLQETPREISFCQFAIQGKETMVVSDSLKDPRFDQNPLVLGDPNIRFYAGAPLVNHEGYALGTLCVLDQSPRVLEPGQLDMLKVLSRQVVLLLELRRVIHRQNKTELALRSSEATMTAFFEASPMRMGVLELVGEEIILIADNRLKMAVTEGNRPINLSESLAEVGNSSEIIEIWRTELERASENNKPVKFEYQLKQNGSRAWISASVGLLGKTEHGTTRFAYIVEDITRRVRIAEELQNNIEKLRGSQALLEEQEANLKISNQRLVELSMTDSLTKLMNRRAFEEQLQVAFEQYRRHNIEVTLIILDVDHFKKFNDTFGHPAGDTVLISVGRILTENLRHGDCASRWGGEEFAVLLPNTSFKEGLDTAERIRKHIESTDNEFHKITASFGVASFFLSMECYVDIVRNADRALYNSKHNGRNCVTLFEREGV